MESHLGAAAGRDIRGAIDLQMTTALELERDGITDEIADPLEIEALAAVFRQPGAGVEEAVVVAAYEDLVLMRLSGEPVELGLDVGDGTGVGEVAGVDEEVPRGDVDVCTVVGVREADDADGGLVAGRGEGSATKEEDNAVDD